MSPRTAAPLIVRARPWTSRSVPRSALWGSHEFRPDRIDGRGEEDLVDRLSAGAFTLSISPLLFAAGIDSDCSRSTDLKLRSGGADLGASLPTEGETGGTRAQPRQQRSRHGPALLVAGDHCIERPHAATAENEGNGKPDGQDVVLESLALLVPVPVHEEALLPVNGQDRA